MSKTKKFVRLQKKAAKLEAKIQRLSEKLMVVNDKIDSLLPTPPLKEILLQSRRIMEEQGM